jgi:hypothetical protein
MARSGVLPAVRLRPGGRLLFDPAEVARALTPAAPPHIEDQDHDPQDR